MAQIGVQLVGANSTLQELREIAARCRDPSGAFEEIFRALETGEEETFAGYGGKYVRTGATKESLTQPDGNMAIREHHGSEFVFGSKVWYAKFQGTTGKGHHHDPSAIVKLTPAVAAQVKARLAAYIHPRDEHGRFRSANA